MDPSEVWDRFKTIAAILFLACLCLYALRCIVAWDVIGVDQFAHFLRGLVVYLVS